MPFRKGRALRMRCITHSNCAEFHSYSFVIYRLSRKVTRKRVRVRAAAAGHVIVSETHALIAWNVSIQRGILVLVVSFNSRIFPLKLGLSPFFFAHWGTNTTPSLNWEKERIEGERLFSSLPLRDDGRLGSNSLSYSSFSTLLIKAKFSHHVPFFSDGSIPSVSVCVLFFSPMEAHKWPTWGSLKKNQSFTHTQPVIPRDSDKKWLDKKETTCSFSLSLSAMHLDSI